MEGLYKGDIVADLIENETEMQNDDKSDSILKEQLEKALRGLPRWNSRIHASIYKWHRTTPVVNKEQCLYWTVGTGPRVGAVLA